MQQQVKDQLRGLAVLPGLGPVTDVVSVDREVPEYGDPNRRLVDRRSIATGWIAIRPGRRDRRGERLDITPALSLSSDPRLDLSVRL